ncbi:MAG: hypothetical protein HAW62_03850 [Endozoicomonadaceae bacterium]|nr:hypothetical protein [Endozoicomonadaceae bacterium]
MYLSIFIILICLAIIISTLFFYLKNGIASTPSTIAVFKALQAHLPNQINGHILEAGAGFGGIAFWLAKKYPYNTVYAIENAWVPFIILWCRKKIQYRSNLQIKCKNINTISFRNTGLVYAFLCQKGMKTLQKQLEKTNHLPCCLISNYFQLPKSQIYDYTLQIKKYTTFSLYFYYFIVYSLESYHLI